MQTLHYTQKGVTKLTRSTQIGTRPQYLSALSAGTSTTEQLILFFFTSFCKICEPRQNKMSAIDVICIFFFFFSFFYNKNSKIAIHISCFQYMLQGYLICLLYLLALNYTQVGLDIKTKNWSRHVQCTEVQATSWNTDCLIQQRIKRLIISLKVKHIILMLAKLWFDIYTPRHS